MRAFGTSSHVTRTIPPPLSMPNQPNSASATSITSIGASGIRTSSVSPLSRWSVIVVGTGAVVASAMFERTISVRHCVPFAPAPRYTAGISTSPAKAVDATKRRERRRGKRFMSAPRVEYILGSFAYSALNERAVDGPAPGAADHEHQRHGRGEDVELESFALLVARPVHEEVAAVDEQRGDDHVHADADGGDARTDAGEQREGAGEVGGDGEDAEDDGDADAGEPAQRALEAPAAEPAEDLLQAVRQDDDAEGETENEQRVRRVGGEDGRQGRDDGAGSVEADGCHGHFSCLLYMSNVGRACARDGNAPKAARE